MGISIYIKQSSLLDKGFTLQNPSGEPHAVAIMRNHHWVCRYEDKSPVVFGECGKTICHVANRWGSSREPILRFLATHGFLAGDDWYEA